MIANRLPLLILFALTSGCGTLLHTSDVAIRAPVEEVAGLPEGARINVVRQQSQESLQFISGTVLKAGPEGIVLMNCDCQTNRTSKTPVLSEIPYVRRYFKATGTGKELIPVMWIPSASIESTVVLEPAPKDYTPPEVHIDLSHGFVELRKGVDFDISIDDLP